jgi:glyoxylase-like metal-dependent hydrolase (beta-lactamase superfamily II)
MKKLIKRLLTVIAIIVISISLLFVGYMIKASFEIKKMTPMETMEIVENIFSIKDSYVNVYMIKDGKQYIAIDCGTNIEVIEQEMKKLKIDPNNVSIILLTHTDGDHVAAMEIFKNAKVILSKQEEKLINGEDSRFLIFRNSIFSEKYSTVEDQQTIKIGNTKIKAFLTPGHTPGSTCYLINEKYLFVGDALSLKNGKIELFNDFFNMDSELAAKSIEIITKIPSAEYIFTAHYGYSDDYRNMVIDWVNNPPD